MMNVRVATNNMLEASPTLLPVSRSYSALRWAPILAAVFRVTSLPSRMIRPNAIGVATGKRTERETSLSTTTIAGIVKPLIEVAAG